MNGRVWLKGEGWWGPFGALKKKNKGRGDPSKNVLEQQVGDEETDKDGTRWRIVSFINGVANWVEIGDGV